LRRQTRVGKFLLAKKQMIGNNYESSIIFVHGCLIDLWQSFV